MKNAITRASTTALLRERQLSTGGIVCAGTVDSVGSSISISARPDELDRGVEHYGRVSSHRRLGGLLNFYERAAFRSAPLTGGTLRASIPAWPSRLEDSDPSWPALPASRMTG